MGLGDLTLLLVGRDSLAQQLLVHLEHRGADIERTEPREALDTIRVAVPDLVIVSLDASGSDAEKIRDGLLSTTQHPRLLVLCAKKDAARTGTYKHDFIGTLEPELGAELIASSIESLCTLFEKQASASRPLRSLIADVRRAQAPAKKTMPMLVAPPPAASVVAAPIAAPVIKAPLPIAAPAPIAAAAAPVAAPVRVSSPVGSPTLSAAPMPISALLAKAEEDTDLAVEISVGSLPPPDDLDGPTAPPPPLPVVSLRAAPPLPVSLRAAPPLPVSLPVAPALPPPVVVQTSSPSVPQIEPVSAGPAEPLLARFSRRQQMIAAGVAAIALLGIGVAAFSSSDGEPDAIAPHASASLSEVATQVATPPAPPAVTTAKPVLLAAPPPVALPSAPTPAPQTSPEADDEDTAADNEGGLDPARARANFLVLAGHRLRKEGRLGMAEASYLKALEAFPNYGRAVSGLVDVHLTRRDGVEALRWAKKLVALQPKRGTHHRLLGDAYVLTGQKTQAAQAWQQGARLGDRVARSRMK